MSIENIPAIDSGIDWLTVNALCAHYEDIERQEEDARRQREAKRREEIEALRSLIEEWLGVTVRADILTGRDVILNGLHFRVVMARRGFAGYELTLVVPCARCGLELVCDLTEGQFSGPPEFRRRTILERIGRILAEPTMHMSCPDPNEEPWAGE